MSTLKRIVLLVFIFAQGTGLTFAQNQNLVETPITVGMYNAMMNGEAVTLPAYTPVFTDIEKIKNALGDSAMSDEALLQKLNDAGLPIEENSSEPRYREPRYRFDDQQPTEYNFFPELK